MGTGREKKYKIKSMFKKTKAKKKNENLEKEMAMQILEAFRMPNR